MSPAPPLPLPPAAERRIWPGRRLTCPLARWSAKDGAEYPRKDDATLGARAWTGQPALPSKIPTTSPARPGFGGLLLRGMVVSDLAPALPCCYVDSPFLQIMSIPLQRWSTLQIRIHT